METSNRQGHKKLSVIIVNFQSKHHLGKCLASIAEKIKRKIDTEIIIINNDCNEDLESVVSCFSDIRLINQEKNIGFGTANNLGAKSAQGEFILFLNPDTEILSKDIGRVLEEFDANEEIGIIGSGLIDEEGEAQEWGAGSETGLWDILRNNAGFPKSRKIWRSKKKIMADWVSAAALFMPRKAFLDVLGFDESIFMYFEDMDLCKRVRRGGKKVVFFPEFKVKHICGGSSHSLKKQKKSYYNSQGYYFEKHKSRLQCHLLRILRCALVK